ncbi:adventurous gliding motility protein CglF [Myxococcota bacterium]|nr:adventurous gliding motility protein CglF [Myxococcota bacterium]
MKLGRNLCSAVVLALGLLAAPTLASAQEEGGGEGAEAGAAEDGVIYRKKTVVSFEDDTIDGDLTRPDGAYVESRKRVRHSNLIRIREDFRERILDSVSSI